MEPYPYPEPYPLVDARLSRYVASQFLAGGVAVAPVGLFAVATGGVTVEPAPGASHGLTAFPSAAGVLALAVSPLSFATVHGFGGGGVDITSNVSPNTSTALPSFPSSHERVNQSGFWILTKNRASVPLLAFRPPFRRVPSRSDVGNSARARAYNECVRASTGAVCDRLPLARVVD